MLTDYKDGHPIYEQIINYYKQLILKGILEQDEQLPSVRSLAMEYSTNPNTIQKAFSLMERQGYLYYSKGKGFFVKKGNLAKKEKAAELHNRILNIVNEAKALGFTPEDLHCPPELFEWQIMSVETNAGGESIRAVEDEPDIGAAILSRETGIETAIPEDESYNGMPISQYEPSQDSAIQADEPSAHDSAIQPDEQMTYESGIQPEEPTDHEPGIQQEIHGSGIQQEEPTAYEPGIQQEEPTAHEPGIQPEEEPTDHESGIQQEKPTDHESGIQPEEPTDHKSGIQSEGTVIPSEEGGNSEQLKPSLIKEMDTEGGVSDKPPAQLPGESRYAVFIDEKKEEDMPSDEGDYDEIGLWNAAGSGIVITVEDIKEDGGDT